MFGVSLASESINGNIFLLASPISSSLSQTSRPRRPPGNELERIVLTCGTAVDIVILLFHGPLGEERGELDRVFLYWDWEVKVLS